MKVIAAKTAGFCFGVERAVKTVYELLESEPEAKICTLGPIVHNESVVEDLKARGVGIISEEEIPSIKEGVIVVIRAHGVGRHVYEALEKSGARPVDATCPFVRKIHKIAQEETEKGRHLLIAGDPSHPEVVGICGWAKEGAYTVLPSVQAAEEFEPGPGEKYTLVSQTTFNSKKFKDMVEILEKKRYDTYVLDFLAVLNTICNATQERQDEARSIAARVDTMLVVGGRHSSNTQKLFEICKGERDNTYYIQTLDDLDSEMFQRSSYVGITAGASTPKKIIEEVLEHVRTKL